MKILFVMQHSGFTFYYESTIRLLAERGHHMVVASERRLESDQLKRLCAEFPQVTYERLPARGNNSFAQRLRTFQDWLRYLEPRYAHARYLRGRVEEKVSKRWIAIGRLAAAAGESGLAVLQAILRLIERTIPAPAQVVEYVGTHRPDVMLVTPLVDVGSYQVDFVKAARRLRIPAAVCVASWDNLTNKGLMRVVPDRAFVWNELQRDEAVSLHRVPPARVTVTGAQPFDHWFTWEPSTSREAFCRSVGLDPALPYILFVGSTVGIAADEPAYVEKWIRQLRTSPEPGLDRVGVLVRPHPKQWARWSSIDLSGLIGTAIQSARAPVDPESRSAYYDALYHSAAVVGVNTSAMIEAAIVGRSVYTWLAPEFEDTQEGTLHFGYLAANGGPVHVARDLDTHFAQVAGALAAERASSDDRLRSFVRQFIRPHGLDVPATPVLVSAIESLGGVGRDYAPDFVPKTVQL